MFNTYKKIIVASIAITIVSVFLYSCNSNTIINQYVEIPSSGWDKNNAVAFNVDINDSISTYNFGINIRNSTTYRYSNLYIFLLTEFPNGNISRDTIECLLADNEGKWLGKGWGEIKESEIILSSGLQFPLAGKYKFLIQQAMRVDTLRGINDVGLLVEKDNSQ